MKEGIEKKPTTLLEAEEQSQVQDELMKREKLSRAAKAIEAILLKEDLTWGDWGTIVEMFSLRISSFVSSKKITLED